MSRKTGLSRLDEVYGQGLDALPDPVSVVGNPVAQVAELTTAIQAVTAEPQPNKQKPNKPASNPELDEQSAFIRRVLASKGRSVESLFRPNVGVFQYLEGAEVVYLKAYADHKYNWETLIVTPDNYDELPHAMKCDISDLDNPETEMSEVMEIIRGAIQSPFSTRVVGQYRCYSDSFLTPLYKMHQKIIEGLQDEKDLSLEEKEFYLKMIRLTDSMGDQPVQYLLNRFVYDPNDLKEIAIHCMKHMLCATIWVLSPDIRTTEGPYTLKFDTDLMVVLMDLIEKASKNEVATSTVLAILESSSFKSAGQNEVYHLLDLMASKSEHKLLECLLKVRKIQKFVLNRALVSATVTSNYNVAYVLLTAGADPFAEKPSAFAIAEARNKSKVSDCSKILQAFQLVANNFGR